MYRTCSILKSVKFGISHGYRVCKLWDSSGYQESVKLGFLRKVESVKLGFLVEDPHGTVGISSGRFPWNCWDSSYLRVCKVGIPHILESVRLGYRGGYARQCLMQVHQAVPHAGTPGSALIWYFLSKQGYLGTFCQNRDIWVLPVETGISGTSWSSRASTWDIMEF